jgi:Putative Ig domain
LLFRGDIVTTFSGATLRKLKVLLSVTLGILVWATVFAGCSGSNSLTITLSPASGLSLNPGQTQTITATVANDSTNGGVTWTLSGPGTLSDNEKTTVVYTAPTTLSVTTTATITATSVANSSVIATESITVNAVLTITTTSLPAGTLNVPYNSFVNAAGAPPPFTWSVISGSLPAGLTFLTTSTSSSAEISGTPTLLGTSNFSVQVTDTSGASVTQALSITVNKPPPLSVSTGSLPDGIVNTSYSQNLQANSGTLPYTWSLANGTLLPTGLSLSATGTISGTPIVTGSFTFAVQVQDSSKPNPQIASAILSIRINPGITNNGRLNGNYAFSVRGFDPDGLFVAAGSFVADGQGNISSGITDINNTTTSLLSQTFTGVYFIGQDGLGTLTLNMTTGGSRTFALSMMANGNANIIEFDDSTGGGTRNSGMLLKQSPPFSTALISGNYAFGLVGIDSSKNRFGEAGNFQAAVVNGQGSIGGGLLDSDSVSGASGSIAVTGGAYSVASSGRGTITLTTAQGTATYALYVVNSTQLLVVGIDPFAPGGNPLVSGTVLQQSTFSLVGLGVFEVTGLSGTTAESQVGQFSATNGSFSLTSDQNSGGTLTTLQGTGAYTVDTTSGRVAFTNGSGFQNSLPVFYLVTTNQSFIIGTDSAVSFGFMAAQSGVPFTIASLSGTYSGGSLAPVDSSASNVVSVAVAGASSLTVTQDVSNANGLTQSQVSGTTEVTDAATGRFTAALGGISEILYMVSPAPTPPAQGPPSQFFQLSTDATARVDIFGQ